MFQGGIHTESSALPTQDLHSLSDSSLRDKVTATLIREEAAESLLLSIQGDAELAALNQVLNRYKAQWWLKHLSWVGANPARYWREQLGEEIEAASSGKNSSSQRKKFSWWFFRSFDMSGEVKYSCSGSTAFELRVSISSDFATNISFAHGVKYELSQLDLDPFYDMTWTCQ